MQYLPADKTCVGPINIASKATESIPDIIFSVSQSNCGNDVEARDMAPTFYAVEYPSLYILKYYFKV